jgi:hypothetical protein
MFKRKMPILDYFDVADFLQKFDHFHQAVNYFSTIDEWFWPQKVGTSLFECIQKAKGDEKKFEVFLDSCQRTRRFSESPLLWHMRQQGCSKNVKRIGVRKWSGVICCCNNDRILEGNFNWQLRQNWRNSVWF